MNSEKYRQSMSRDDGNQSMSRDDGNQSRAQAGGVFSLFKGEKKQPKKAEKKKNTATEGSKKVKKEKRREREKEKEKEKAEDTFTTQTQVQAVTTVPAAPINTNIEAWIRETLATPIEKLRDEFREHIAKYTRNGMTVEQFTKNCNPDISVTKNRYQDVPCQDQSAVILQPPAPCSYIHANYVGTPVSKTRFICTQGPLEQTIEDFWWMIVQQKVEQIVMLCKVVEMGKNKCSQYWPVGIGEKKEFKGSKLVVENVSGTKPMQRDAEILITQLKITVDGQSMSVRHLQWTEWPDRGVPMPKSTSLELLSAVRGSKAPIVVHCSAGIGRTGTIVAIEYILEVISTNTTAAVPPLKDLARELRDQRAFSIQNDLQYLYIYRIMLFYFLEKYRDKYLSLAIEVDGLFGKFASDYRVAVGQS